jgi:hypothetical protein
LTSLLLGVPADEAGEGNRAVVALRALGADPDRLRSQLLDRAARAS